MYFENPKRCWTCHKECGPNQLFPFGFAGRPGVICYYCNECYPAVLESFHGKDWAEICWKGQELKEKIMANDITYTGAEKKWQKKKLL